MNKKEEGNAPGISRLFPRRPVRLVQGTLLLLLLTCLLWTSGLVQYRLFPFVVEQVTGIRIQFWMEGFRPLYLRDLQVRSSTADPSMPPLFRADVLRLEWLPRFPAFKGPLLSAIHLSNVQVYLDNSEPGNSNYAFLMEDTGADGSTMNPWAVLPETIQVSGLALYTRTPDRSAGVQGLDVRLSAASPDHFLAVIGGDNIMAGWGDGPAGALKQVTESRANATLRREGSLVYLEADVALPDILTLKGEGSFDFADTPAFEVQVDRVQAEGFFFNEMISPLLPLPVSFSSLHLSPAHLSGTWPETGVMFSELNLDGRVEDLQIGDAEAPWYTGPLHFKAQGDYEGSARATFEATFNEGQVLSGALEQAGDRLRLNAQLNDWDREQVAAVWPRPLEEWRLYLNGLRGISASFQGDFSEEALTLESVLSPVFENSLQPRVTASIAYSAATGLTVEGLYALDKGEARVEARYEPGSSFVVAADADALPVQALATLLPGTDFSEVAMVLDGSFKLEGKPGKNSRFTTSLASKKARVGPWNLPEALLPLVLNLEGGIPAEFSRIDVHAGKMTLGEAVSFTLSSTKFNVADRKLSGALAASGNVEPLAAMAGIKEAWGSFTGEGTLVIDRDMRVGFKPAALFSESLGYGDLTLPYGQSLKISATVVDISPWEKFVQFNTIQASLGDGTTFDAGDLRLSSDMSVTSGNATFKTDFAPFVAKRYLDAATGTLDATLDTFSLDRNGITGTLSYVCEATEIVLPDHMAILSAVSIQGRTALGPELDGQGKAVIAALQAAGTQVVDLTGVIYSRGESIAVEDVAFTLFGGAVDARLETRPFETGRPLFLSGQVKDLDLDLFTKEFKPGDVVLTGLVNGTVSLGIENASFASLDVELESTENFSMDRDTVEQLMMRQFMGDMKGGKQMERVVQSVLGKDAQRKFDSATAKLWLEEGRIRGNIKCFSDKLNLDMDVRADVEAFMEALRIRQKPVP